MGGDLDLRSARFFGNCWNLSVCQVANSEEEQLVGLASMRAARVIVELRDGRWIAYFGDELYTAAFGPDASQALLNLLHTMGGGNFLESGLQPIDEATQKEHFEFLATFQAAPFPTQFGHSPSEFQGPGQS